jgi:hypothetical protein
VASFQKKESMRSAQTFSPAAPIGDPAGRRKACSTTAHLCRISCGCIAFGASACTVYGEQLQQFGPYSGDAQIRDAGPDVSGSDDGTPSFDGTVDAKPGHDSEDANADGSPSGVDAERREADATASRDVEGGALDSVAGERDGEGGALEGGGLQDAEGGASDSDAPAVADAGQDSGCIGSIPSHDEDGDGVLDGCDNCPSVPNADQTDQREIAAGLAADGVGDACDPRPSLAGDAIVLFDSFVSVQIDTQWSVYAGTWQSRADTLVETATSDSQQIDRITFPSGSDYLVETRFTLDALPTIDSRTTLTFRMDTLFHNGWGCAVSNRSLLAVSTIVGGDQGEMNPPQTAIPPPQVGDRFRLQAGAHGMNVFCLLPDTGQRVTRTSLLNPNGVAGLRTHQAAATFEYLLVYHLGGPLP